MNPDNLKENKRVPIMHGEIWLIPVDEVPAGDTKTVKTFIAGHSETGHHHVLESTETFDIVIAGPNKFFVLKFPAKILHRKQHGIHETKILAPGSYEIREKQEYNVWTKHMQRVFD